MSLNPVTVLPFSLGTALKVMEEGKSQISVLPTNEDTEGILGLIDHDIYDPNVG